MPANFASPPIAAMTFPASSLPSAFEAVGLSFARVFAGRRRNCDIDLFYRAERGKRLVEFLRVADHQRRELV